MKRSGPLSRRSSLKRTVWGKKPPDPEKAVAAKKRQRKRARQKRESDFGQHATWVRSLRCEVPGCTRADVEAHHEEPRKMGGSSAPTAHRLVALCRWHHTEGPEARHKIGLEKFNVLNGTDLKAAAARNWAASPYNSER